MMGKEWSPANFCWRRWTALAFLAVKRQSGHRVYWALAARLVSTG